MAKRWKLWRVPTEEEQKPGAINETKENDVMKTSKRTYAEYAEAFTIFAKYEEGSFGTDAEHDVIFSGPHYSHVSADDLRRLDELGWRPGDGLDGHEDCERFYKYT
jgi:hypothetical protein